MALPYFFVKDIGSDLIVLEEDTSKHVVAVLRMEKGEKLLLTDGKGLKAVAQIVDDNRKRCRVQVMERTEDPPSHPQVTIAISLLKNASRFEWFLEKATELGVNRIVPLLCSRTEKEKFRHDRLTTILVSAMLQSQQCWLPLLEEPAPLSEVLRLEAAQRFIAHCEEGTKQPLSGQRQGRIGDSIILIGPEGDFTQAEITAALETGFLPVALGDTRLRTETAGMVAAALLKLQ